MAAEHQNLRDRLQALARRAGSPVVELFYSQRTLRGIVKAVGVDYVEFACTREDGTELATYLIAIREIRGLMLDSVELQREKAQRMFELPDDR